MIIIISQSDDIISKNVYNLIKKNSNDIKFFDESIFFSDVQFSIKRDGNKINGFLFERGKRIQLTKIEGVLLRLQRSWWPSLHLHLQDQVFIYHETIASWFSILETLNCPIINRFPLGWWLQEKTFFDITILNIAKQLKTNIDESELPTIMGNGEAAISTNEIDSYYVAGSKIIPTLRSGSNIKKILLKKILKAVKLLEQNGIYFCRLDFKNNGVTKLHNIDIAPVIDNEPDIIVKKISKAIVGRLS